MGEMQWAADEIVLALVRKRDEGETPVVVQELRDEAGLGEDDFTKALDEARESGRITEDAPGMWTLFESVPEPEAEDEVEGAPDERLHGEARAGPRPRAEMRLVTEGQGAVRITRAMLDALDDVGLGKIVRAGAQESGEFTFIVS